MRLLCWKSAMPVAATQHFFPFADRRIFAGTKVKFVLDGKLPLGACHHQKMIVVDDAIGFCGGGDIGPDRWDTPQHLDDDPRREKTRRDNKDFDSRHEVMGLVDGEAARALGALFRDRWPRAPARPSNLARPCRRPRWPGEIEPQFSDIEVGLSRTGGGLAALSRGARGRGPAPRGDRRGQDLHLHGEPVLHLAADRRGTGQAAGRARRVRRWC